jgi:hypothetical protein
MMELTPQQWMDERIGLTFHEYKLIDIIMIGWKFGNPSLCLADLYESDEYNVDRHSADGMLPIGTLYKTHTVHTSCYHSPLTCSGVQ